MKVLIFILFFNCYAVSITSKSPSAFSGTIAKPVLLHHNTASCSWDQNKRNVEDSQPICGHFMVKRHKYLQRVKKYSGIPELNFTIAN